MEEETEYKEMVINERKGKITISLREVKE